MSPRANAHPTKRLFLQMLTRDLALEDAILDLVDNSIDSLLRNNRYESFYELVTHSQQGTQSSALPLIDISYSSKSFKIKDECGGMSYNFIKDHALRFGTEQPNKEASLSVYGIGLKRAIFKLGKDIIIESRTHSGGCKVVINVDDWASRPEDWTFQINKISKAQNKKEVGTTITIKNLLPEVLERFNDGQFDKTLHDQIAYAYTFFLNNNVHIRINKHAVSPKLIPIGDSPSATTAVESFDVDNVHVTLIAGLAERTNGKWQAEPAGWYILCNGRTITFADKTEATGWGTVLARFVPKYRGFIGIASFYADDPELLPWTTTKRGLNIDSPVYQRTFRKMTNIASPIIEFLNKMYTKDESEKEYYRKIADSVQKLSLKAILNKGYSTFTYKKLKVKGKPKSTTVLVRVKTNDIDKAKDCLNKPQWGPPRLVEYALAYLIEQECEK